jgi:hypothetical protein
LVAKTPKRAASDTTQRRSKRGQGGAAAGGGSATQSHSEMANDDIESDDEGADVASDSDSAHQIHFSKRRTESEQISAAEQHGIRAAMASDSDSSDSDPSDAHPSDADPSDSDAAHKETVAFIREMLLEHRQTHVAGDNTQNVADGSSVSDQRNQSQLQLRQPQPVASHRESFGGKKTTTALDVASEIHKVVKWCLQQPHLRTPPIRNIHLTSMFVKLCADFQKRLQNLTSGSGTYEVVKKDAKLDSQRLVEIWTEEVAQRLPALVLVATDLNRIDDVDQRHQDAELHQINREVRECLNNIIDELVGHEEDVNAALHHGRSPSEIVAHIQAALRAQDDTESDESDSDNDAADHNRQHDQVGSIPRLPEVASLLHAGVQRLLHNGSDNMRLISNTHTASLTPLFTVAQNRLQRLTLAPGMETLFIDIELASAVAMLKAETRLPPRISNWQARMLFQCLEMLMDGNTLRLLGRLFNDPPLHQCLQNIQNRVTRMLTDISEHAEQPAQILPNSDHDTYQKGNLYYCPDDYYCPDIIKPMRRSWLYITNDTDDVKNSAESPLASTYADEFEFDPDQQESIHFRSSNDEDEKTSDPNASTTRSGRKYAIANTAKADKVAVRHDRHTNKSSKYLIDVKIEESEFRRLIISFARKLRNFRFLSEVAVVPPRILNGVPPNRKREEASHNNSQGDVVPRRGAKYGAKGGQEKLDKEEWESHQMRAEEQERERNQEQALAEEPPLSLSPSLGDDEDRYITNLKRAPQLRRHAADLRRYAAPTKMDGRIHDLARLRSRWPITDEERRDVLERWVSGRTIRASGGQEKLDARADGDAGVAPGAAEPHVGALQSLTARGAAEPHVHGAAGPDGSAVAGPQQEIETDGCQGQERLALTIHYTPQHGLSHKEFCVILDYSSGVTTGWYEKAVQEITKALPAEASRPTPAEWLRLGAIDSFPLPTWSVI